VHANEKRPRSVRHRLIVQSHRLLGVGDVRRFKSAKALYMPGLVAKHHNPVIMAMAKRLQSRGMAPKAIVGASMRRLVHLIYGVINSGKRFDMAIPMRGLTCQDGI